MTADSPDDDLHDAHDAQLRDALLLTAPPGLATRVLQVRERSARAERRARGAAIAAVVVVGLSGAFGAGRATRHEAAVAHTVAPAGRLSATTRTTARVPGAVVVSEPGAALAWRDGGVTLDAGEAFFRVDPVLAGAAPFVVSTPAGDVTATGTCFRITLTKEPTVTLALPSPSALKGAAVSAVATAALMVVVVDEGSVRVDTPRGAAAVGAGERATIGAVGAPVVTEIPSSAAAERAARRARAALEAAPPVDVTSTTALRAENDRLRAVVAAQDEELALLDVDRAAKEGEPRAFPRDLPARFAEEALTASLTAALAQSGVAASVTRVDCAEYPCMVWGTWGGDTRALTDTLKGTDGFAAYSDDDAHVFGWGSGDGPEVFALALRPKAAEGAPRDEALQKRMHHRAREHFETLREPPTVAPAVE